jgi:hypothetical protein
MACNSDISTYVYFFLAFNLDAPNIVATGGYRTNQIHIKECKNNVFHS